jgi:hypothetical protein
VIELATTASKVLKLEDVKADKVLARRYNLGGFTKI